MSSGGTWECTGCDGAGCTPLAFCVVPAQSQFACLASPLAISSGSLLSAVRTEVQPSSPPPRRGSLHGAR
eukprot:scaffold237485_cov24-Tisochrysis_lutea.AAC.6